MARKNLQRILGAFISAIISIIIASFINSVLGIPATLKEMVIQLLSIINNTVRNEGIEYLALRPDVVEIILGTGVIGIILVFMPYMIEKLRIFFTCGSKDNKRNQQNRIQYYANFILTEFGKKIIFWEGALLIFFAIELAVIYFRNT